MWDGFISDEISYLANLRDLKFKIINDGDFLRIDYSKVKENEKILDFISDTFPGDVITGSLSLSLFGLLNRDIGDIDILIKDGNRYNDYKLEGYGGDIILNRLGYKIFDYKNSFFSRRKSYEVDFFTDNGAIYKEFNFKNKSIKVHHPIEVISHKINMIDNRLSSTSKHRGDLYRIFSGINFD